MLRHLLVLSLFVLCVAASGQETKKGTPSKGSEADVHFLNGSTVRVQLLSEKLEIETPYGKLFVPLKEVRAIEVGSHLPEGHAEKIAAAVKKLAAADFREREKAVAALLELGPYSYAAAVEASRSKELEVATRGKEVVAKLNARHPKKDLKLMTDDRVITPTFPIVGRILTPSIKAKADYFGSIELNLADMRTLRAISGPSLEVEVAIDASKYGTRDRTQWLATGFETDGRSAIVITAKGQIDLEPNDPGQILVGPNGMRSGPGVGFGGKKGVGISKTAGGLLIGKIGEDGDTFVIGERYDGTPAATGKLYLQINPSPYNAISAGSYDVKAARKE